MADARPERIHALRARLDAIRAAPAGPQVAAYLDFDGTVIEGYSGVVFYRRRLLGREVGLPELARTIIAGARGVETAQAFDELLALTLASWAGREVDEVRALAHRVFVEELGPRLHREMWDVVAAHQARGHRVVLASSATRFQVEPMAEALGADALLCTELEVEDGRLTGRTTGASMWSAGKAAAVRRDAAGHDVDLARSFSYSNGGEDVPMLASVGHPVAVSPGKVLRAVAGERGWPVLDCLPRQGLVPSPGEVVRTTAFAGGVLGSLATGVGVGLLSRSRRRGVDHALGMSGGVGLALAGIDLRVSGGQHLVEPRPCVFVFNHTSWIDVPLLMKLLRGRFTGVLRRDGASLPWWGQLLRVADVAMVDRADGATGREALEPAVRRLRQDGVSMVLAPEGTRAPTPTLGPFRQAAFLIAIDAGVPVVPIVLRNASDVMSRDARTLRGGVVDVRVLPPVDTSGWSADTVAEHAREVRELFGTTLRDWTADDEAGDLRPAGP